MAAATSAQGELLESGPLQISPEQHLARAGGRPLRLSLRELRLLTELARRVDRIVARDELFLLVWGRVRRADDRSVDVYIRRLRVKLNVALPEWSFIHTHFGLGYRLFAEQTGSTQIEAGISQPVNNWPPRDVKTDPAGATNSRR